MTTPSSGPSGLNDPQPDGAFGGADAVPDTVQASEHGAEPNAGKRDDYTARVSPGGGMSLVGWLVALLAVAVLLYFAIGAFR